MNALQKRINRLEKNARAMHDLPFSHAVIDALLSGIVPEGWTAEQWAMRQAERQAAPPFNENAVLRVLGKGESK